MGNLSYVQGTAGDLPDVRALLVLCGLPFDDLSADHLEHFVLCRSEERLVGTIGLEPLGEVALLRSLAVTPNLRGRGVGHGLWERACVRAREGGIRQLFLLTTTADALFVRWGFRFVSREDVPHPIQQTSEYRSGCPSTAAVMRAELV